MTKTRIRKAYCPNCHYVGRSRFIRGGNAMIELTLWLFFCFPGMLYTMWRLSAKSYVCAKCGYENIVPANRKP